MSTRTNVLHVLRGEEAARIRFTFPFAAGTVTISPKSFDYVASAIEMGKVKVVPTTVFPAGVAGQYISGTPNELHVLPVVGREQLGQILHECTHALFDLTQTHVTANEDEAAAYVVDALYFRMTGLLRARAGVTNRIQTAGSSGRRLTAQVCCWNARHSRSRHYCLDHAARCGVE